VSSYDSIARYDVIIHAKVSTSVFDKRINFLERAFIKKNFNAFTRRHFSFLVLPVNPFLASANLTARFTIT
jgi:hypothetical protein